MQTQDSAAPKDDAAPPKDAGRPHAPTTLRLRRGRCPTSSTTCSTSPRLQRRASTSKRLDLSARPASILEDLAAPTPGANVNGVVQLGVPTATPIAGLMQIVLQNLLRNAWKFTGHREAARIEFAASRMAPNPPTSSATMARLRQRSAGRSLQALPAPAHRERVLRHRHRPRHSPAHRCPHEAASGPRARSARAPTFYFTLGSPSSGPLS